MKIYHLEKKLVIQKKVDPRLGIVNERVEQVLPSPFTSLQHDGVTYLPNADGSFDVPSEVGNFFLKQSGWEAGIPPLAPDYSAIPVETNATSGDKAKTDTTSKANVDATAFTTTETASTSKGK
jgi:hypothetical protein